MEQNKEKTGNITNKYFVGLIRNASNFINSTIEEHKRLDVSHINANNISKLPNCKRAVNLSDPLMPRVSKVFIAKSDGRYAHTYSYYPKTIGGLKISICLDKEEIKAYRNYLRADKQCKFAADIKTYHKGDYLCIDKSGKIDAHFTKKEIHEHYLVFDINEPRNYKVEYGQKESILSPGFYIARCEPDRECYAIMIHEPFKYRLASVTRTIILGEPCDWLVKEAESPIVEVVKSSDFASKYVLAERLAEIKNAQ